jgi:hypothetical protein
VELEAGPSEWEFGSFGRDALVNNGRGRHTNW